MGVRPSYILWIFERGWVSMAISADKIKRTNAYRRIKSSLVDQLERSGNATAYYLNLVNDYMMLYTIKELANADILENGISVEWRNSETQYGRKQNESVNQILKTNQQMVKLLKMLKIEPNSSYEDDEEM